ncbi:hypothetical protein F4677DRAFT_346991 [Hypoxylon crocopeplum]|nr:hypothetical protein F4677DRAFT_346991 [Hypoxylon crocopeplum]
MAFFIWVRISIAEAVKVQALHQAFQKLRDGLSQQLHHPVAHLYFGSISLRMIDLASSATLHRRSLSRLRGVICIRRRSRRGSLFLYWLPRFAHDSYVFFSIHDSSLDAGTITRLVWPRNSLSDNFGTPGGNLYRFIYDPVPGITNTYMQRSSNMFEDSSVLVMGFWLAIKKMGTSAPMGGGTWKWDGMKIWLLHCVCNLRFCPKKRCEAIEVYSR